MLLKTLLEYFNMNSIYLIDNNGKLYAKKITDRKTYDQHHPMMLKNIEYDNSINAIRDKTEFDKYCSELDHLINTKGWIRIGCCPNNINRREYYIRFNKRTVTKAAMKTLYKEIEDSNIDNLVIDAGEKDYMFMNMSKNEFLEKYGELI